VASGLAGSAALAAGLFPALDELPFPGQPRSRWDGEATARGWSVPRNPSRRPVVPRRAFEVEEAEQGLEIVSSHEGRLSAIRLQWPDSIVEPAFSAQKSVFHDILTRLSSDVEVHVVAEGERAAARLDGLLAEWKIPSRERVAIHSLTLASGPDLLYCPLTLWSRDGAVLARAPDGAPVVLVPRSFRSDGEVDPGLNRVVIQGTAAAPAMIGARVPGVRVRRASLSFEGGDVVAGRRAVLVGGDTIARNMASLRLTREAVLARFEQLFGRPVIAVEPQPDFHIDLGFTFLDEGTVAVADPSWGLRLAERARDEALGAMVAATRTSGLIERYRRAGAVVEAAGLVVVTLPNLCGVGLETPYLTYNNVLLEEYVEAGGRVRRVYMPVYGIPVLDEAAREIYRSHGWTVVDMPSARASTRLWGAVRCATGELRVDG
jgi:hypothetical protein